MTIKIKKKNISKTQKENLEEIFDKADHKRSYQSAIKKFEVLEKRCVFNSETKLKLGLLYDHRAMQLRGAVLLQKKDGVFHIDREQAKNLLSKARLLYTTITKQEKNNLFISLAFHGLARIESELNHHKKAIYYETQAYTYMQKVPKKQRDVLAIGNTFLLAKQYKQSERWFLKELHDFGMSHIGVVANILIFYEARKMFTKALPYAHQLKFLLKKSGYNTEMKGKKNRTLEILLKRIHCVIKNAGNK
jgi:hypothetical protein